MAEANQEAKDGGGPVVEKSDGRNDQEIEKEIEYGEAGDGAGYNRGGGRRRIR